MGNTITNYMYGTQETIIEETGDEETPGSSEEIEIVVSDPIEIKQSWETPRYEDLYK